MWQARMKISNLRRLEGAIVYIVGTTCFKLTTSITGAVDSLKGFSEMWLLTRLQLSSNNSDVTKILTQHTFSLTFYITTLLASVFFCQL